MILAIYLLISVLITMILTVIVSLKDTENTRNDDDAISFALIVFFLWPFLIIAYFFEKFK